MYPKTWEENIEEDMTNEYNLTNVSFVSMNDSQVSMIFIQLNKYLDKHFDENVLKNGSDVYTKLLNEFFKGEFTLSKSKTTKVTDRVGYMNEFYMLIPEEFLGEPKLGKGINYLILNDDKTYYFQFSSTVKDYKKNLDIFKKVLSTIEIS